MVSWQTDSPIKKLSVCFCLLFFFLLFFIPFWWPGSFYLADRAKPQFSCVHLSGNEAHISMEVNMDFLLELSGIYTSLSFITLRFGVCFQ